MVEFRDNGQRLNADVSTSQCHKMAVFLTGKTKRARRYRQQKSIAPVEAFGLPKLVGCFFVLFFVFKVTRKCCCLYVASFQQAVEGAAPVRVNEFMLMEGLIGKITYYLNESSERSA